MGRFVRCSFFKHFQLSCVIALTFFGEKHLHRIKLKSKHIKTTKGKKKKQSKSDLLRQEKKILFDPQRQPDNFLDQGCTRCLS